MNSILTGLVITMATLGVSAYWPAMFFAVRGIRRATQLPPSRRRPVRAVMILACVLGTLGFFACGHVLWIMVS